MQEQSRAFAERLLSECRKDNRRCEVNAAWKLTLTRPPSPAERSLAGKFFTGGGSLPDMCLALLNRNEFVYVP